MQMPAAVVKVAIGALVAMFIACLCSRAALGATHRLSERFVCQANALTVWMAFVCAWPVLWYVVTGEACMRAFPLCYVGLAWPLALFMVDMVFISHQTIESEGMSKKSMFSFDSNAISGLSFALGGLLVSNLGKSFAQSSSPITLAVVFLCLAFVLPSPSLQPGTSAGIAIQTAQKACLYCCIGLLVTATGITMHAGLRHKQRQPALIGSVMQTLDSGVVNE